MTAGLSLSLGIARPVGKAKITNKGAGESGPLFDAKALTELKQKVFQRDNFTCKCCGFVSQKYQEVHHLNNNPADNRESNLATVCIFCHQCFNLEKVSEMRSGVLIWLPEISQARLNHLARAIYVARISQGAMAEAARKTLDTLMTRRDEAKKRLSTDDPYILAEVLRDYLGEKHYHFRDKKLAGVKLLPLDRRIIKEADLEFNQFPQILAYWRSKNGPFGGKTPPQWISLYKAAISG